MAVELRKLFNIAAATLLLAFGVLGVAFAEDRVPTSFHLGQVTTQGKEIVAYFDLCDAAGQPVSTVSADQFSASFGKTPLKVESVRPFASTGEGIAAVLLVDVSQSLSRSQFASLRAALSGWIDSMAGSDQAALVTFGEKTTLFSDFSNDREKLKASIQTLQRTDSKTQLYDGLMRALELAERRDASLPLRRAIVLLSDGIDDPVLGEPTLEEVREKLRESRIPVYVIVPVQKNAGNAPAKGLEAVGSLARLSGGAVFSVGKDSPFEVLYPAVFRKLRDAFVARIDASVVSADGSLGRFQMTYSSGGRGLSDSADLRLFPTSSAQIKETPQPEAKEKSLKRWILPGVGILLIAGGIWGLFSSLRKLLREKSTPKEPASAGKSPKETEPERVVIPKKGLKLIFTTIGDSSGSAIYPVTVHDRLSIGRSRENGLSIPKDPSISSKHCEISYANGALYVRDLGSTNGTFVNGVPISGLYRLQDGDVLMLGKTELRLRIGKEG